MPTYLYKCPKGHTQDVFFKMSEKPETVPCNKRGCRCQARNIPAVGGIQSDDHPLWLNDDLRGALQDTDLIRKGKVKPIESRSEYNEHLRREGLVCVG